MSISYLATEAFSGFKRARISTLTAITSLAIAVLLLGLLIRMGYNAYYMAQKLREMIVVEVFLKDGKWHFKADGSSIVGGLSALCKLYGVNI
jgi:cell division protein FtsX